MLPVTFEGHNLILKKPADMTDEQCSDLPVFHGDDANGFPVFISCWRFSKEDLEEIKRTGEIFLTVVGNGMPPVELSTENPFL